VTHLIQITGTQPAPAPSFHVIAGQPSVLFLTAGSQIFMVEEGLAEELQKATPEALEMISSLRAEGQRASRSSVRNQPLAVSLNIAQSCNLQCSYCYADEGRFGGSPRKMDLETAKAAIDHLIAGAKKKPVSVGFIGGEPLLNRQVLHAAVPYAAVQAERVGCPISFGITTNGTLITPEDIALFRAHRFAVTVSLDGGRQINDRLRRARNASGGFDRVVRRIRALLLDPGSARVAARATIDRSDFDIDGRLNALREVGFSEAGVSPLRTSPDPTLALTSSHWPAYLSAMKEAAEQEWRRVRGRGEQFFFSNLAIALKQLHRGEYRTLPCGAGDNYVSVNASGDYFICHRTVDDPKFFLGGLETGPSQHIRQSFVDSRRVDLQQPCQSCWARYLCGGGCHAEVLQSGRSGCDYIRGWLEYCIALYPRVLAERPDLIGAT